MAGEPLAQSAVEPRLGLAGDRAWAVRDVAAGEIRGAKKLPALLDCRARYLEEPTDKASSLIELDLGPLGHVRSDDPEVSARLSQRIEREVLLCPRAPASDSEHYRRAVPVSDMEAEIREGSALLPEEELPSLEDLPADLSIVTEYVSPPGTYFDFFDIHILSAQSLASLAECAPDSVIDSRRFRPNLLVELDAPGEPPSDWPEIGWVGHTLAIGEAEFEIVMPMMRCVMTTHAQQDLPKDPSIMRALVRDAGMNLGVGAQVRQRGRIRVGDEIRICERSSTSGRTTAPG
jgi:uncharacterized protein YcbX